MNKKTNYNKIIFLFWATFLTTSYPPLSAVKYGAPLLMQLAKQIQDRGFLATDDEKDIQSFFASHGRNPNISFEGGNTLLHYAIMLEDDQTEMLVDAEFSPRQELVRFLLFNLEADPNIPNFQKQTPLHLAIARKKEPVIQLLLKHKKIRLQDPDIDGLTPLHLAAMTDNSTVVEYLLSKGAPFARDHFNRSPLFYAVQNQNPRTTLRFLPLSTVTDVLLTFHQLEELHQEDSLKFYATHLQPIIKRQEEDNYSTFLHTAVAAKDVIACIFLINIGVNQHLEDKYGETPFYLALKTETEPLIRALKGDVDLNTLTYKKQPVLLHFARERYYKTVQILIDLGASPFVKDREGKSVIYYALVNHEEVLLRTLNQHHEIDRDTVDGMPLLHFFIKTGNRKMVRLLHAMGASLATKNACNKSAFYCMAELKQLGILADTLELKMPKTPHSGIDIFNAAREAGKTDALTALIDGEMDIKACDEHGRNLLFKAVEDEDEPGVETLLHFGVSPTTVDIGGNTLLHFAAYHNKQTACITAKLIPFCIEELETIDITNRDGQSPLHVAAMVGNALIATLLLGRGANVTLKDRQQRTPLTYTYEQKNIPLAQIFARAWIHRIAAHQSTVREFATDILESSRALARIGNPIVEDLPFLTTMNGFFTTCIEEDVAQGRIPEDLGDTCVGAISSTLSEAPTPR